MANLSPKDRFFESSRSAGKKNTPDNAKESLIEGGEVGIEAGHHLALLGKSSATDKLLGLDLRPTILGVLIPPPGNSDFIRHLSPTRRRTILRNLLSNQRKRMGRLAGFLRKEKDNQRAGDKNPGESFLASISEPPEIDKKTLDKALSDLGKTAKMLDVLDELLTMQDYTISQIGTFSKG